MLFDWIISTYGSFSAAVHLPIREPIPWPESVNFQSQQSGNCLSLIAKLCGMYDFSGEFAFQIGVPAKKWCFRALMLGDFPIYGYCSGHLDLTRWDSVRVLNFASDWWERFVFINIDSLTGAFQQRSIPRMKGRKNFKRHPSDGNWSRPPSLGYGLDTPTGSRRC